MTTERRNPRTVDIDLFPTERILKIINAEDSLVPAAVAAAIPEIVKVVEIVVEVVRGGGRIIYVGAGTSGRIAMLDAAECPLTFGIPPDTVQAVVAGGPKALAQAIEGAEDDEARAAADLRARKVSAKDLVIGIAASGKTPYTASALAFARSKGARTVAIVASENSPMARNADILVHVEPGPEVITGSTRMKAATAQKLILNMISTAAMIRLGKTYSNWMVNVGMTNSKLRDRGIQILREILGVSAEDAKKLAEASGGELKTAVVMGAFRCSRKEAERRLSGDSSTLRNVLGHLGTGRE